MMRCLVLDTRKSKTRAPAWPVRTVFLCPPTVKGARELVRPLCNNTHPLFMRAPLSRISLPPNPSPNTTPSALGYQHVNCGDIHTTAMSAETRAIPFSASQSLHRHEGALTWFCRNGCMGRPSQHEMAGVYRKTAFQYKDRVEWAFPCILRITGKAHSWDNGVKYPTFNCCSITKSCSTLCDPVDCSTPGSPVLQ